MKQKTSARGGSASGRKKQLVHWLKVAVVGIALGLGLQFVRAWTEPTVAPPNGNVGAPINTSGNYQTKSGRLDISGGSAMPNMWDSDNWNFNLDPTGNSRLNYLTTDNIRNLGQIDADVHVSAPWIYGQVSAPQICLNGDCRNSWPDAYAAPSYVCQIDMWGGSGGLDCGTNYYKYFPWGSLLIGTVYFHASCAGSGDVYFPCW